MMKMAVATTRLPWKTCDEDDAYNYWIVMENL